MVINKNELYDFAGFLRSRFDATPMLRTGDGDELMRAVIGSTLLIAIDLNNERASVWCSDETLTTELWAAWRGLRVVSAE